MKRDEIIKQCNKIASTFINDAEVFTNGENYPKCQICTISERIADDARPGAAITPYLRPMDLLMYVRGMAAAIKLFNINSQKSI